MLNYLCKKFSP